MRGKIALLGAAAGLLFTLAAPGTAQADHRHRERKCWERINREEHKLERDIRRHGWYSRQAQHRREKLRRLHSQCGFSFRSRGLYDYGYWDHGRGRGRDRDDDYRWRGGRRSGLLWYWSRDGRRHRHSRDGSWCHRRH